MKKINTSPISGAAEFTPALQAQFDAYRRRIAEMFLGHGFLFIETPLIERAEILLAKAGGETEQQIYRVIKTGDFTALTTLTDSPAADTAGFAARLARSADQALRFDHTVPLARYVVEHENDLTFPFQVAQIGKSFRGERAQKGRFRELYQCDVDILGRETLPLAYDATVITTLLAALFSLKLPEIILRLSNRHLFNGLARALNLDAATALAVSAIIDRSEKVTPEQTETDLKSLNLTEESIVKITALLRITGDFETAKTELENLEIDDPEFHQGIAELAEIWGLLSAQSLADHVVIDLKVIRGLDYYTGTVFEAVLRDFPEIGSIAGGGRYDNLTGFFSERRFPGVGASIGLSRLFYLMTKHQLIFEEVSRPPYILILPLSPAEFAISSKLAQTLRSDPALVADLGRFASALPAKTAATTGVSSPKIAVAIDFTARRLAAKLSAAGKTADFAIIVGDREAKTGELILKNLRTGESKAFKI